MHENEMMQSTADKCQQRFEATVRQRQSRSQAVTGLNEAIEQVELAMTYEINIVGLTFRKCSAQKLCQKMASALNLRKLFSIVNFCDSRKEIFRSIDSRLTEAPFPF
jgi:hypothetical protein